MAPVPLVLDTSAMRDKDFRHWLAGYHGQKVLPAVAYVELSTYFIGSKHKTQSQVDEMLRSLGIEIRWYRMQEARITAHLMISYGSPEKIVDRMIASHANIAPWVVVTNNVRDFSFLRDRVKTPREIMASYR